MDQELLRHLEALDAKTIGERIRVARTAAGLTQPELGGDSASAAHISRIERGERRAGVRLLGEFAERLGVPLRELVMGPSAADESAVYLRLDHAELELVGGSPERALEAALEVSVAAVGREVGLVERARLVVAQARRALGDEQAEADFESLMRHAQSATTRLRAATALSSKRREAGDLLGAISVAREALAASAEVVEVGAEDAVKLQVTLAAALFEAGDESGAQEVCVSALAVAEDLKSPSARAAAYWNMSVIQAESGAIDAALTLARRALHLLEDDDSARHLARMRTQLGTILLRADPPQIEEAKLLLDLAGRELGMGEANVVDLARNQLVLARAQFMDGDAEQARSNAEEALSRAGDLPLVEMAGLTLLGQVAASTGDLEAAKGHYVKAIHVLTSIGADRGAGQMWFDLGNLLDEAGMTTEARDAYKRAASSTGLDVRTQALRVVSPSARLDG